MVKGISPGEATIKATTVDGAFDAICNVRINAPEFKCLTFTSTGETTISLVKEGSPDDVSLEYSVNRGTWTAYTVGNAIALTDGAKVSFRAGADGNTSFSKSDNPYYNYYKFAITGSGAVAASGDIMSLLDREGSLTIPSSYCFCQLFDGCTILTEAPDLPATTLAERCYSKMFNGCTSLTTAPDLPATTLTDLCYFNMFYGCTNLTTAPDLPATSLAERCYDSMFAYCTSLTTAPELPATTLADSCYHFMFAGCAGLTTASELHATTLVKSCYHGMFWGCTSLTTAPELPATSLSESCYRAMFAHCTSLTTAPKLPATTLAEKCYCCMFMGCTSLSTAPELPAITLAKDCYLQVFMGCTSLTTAPRLPATTLAYGCYEDMFASCTSLTTAPELPATTLEMRCYQHMFSGCTSLTTAPKLPATTMAWRCYSGMFSSCTSLTTAPELPATTLADYCYYRMFQRCTSLTTAPELPATTLSEGCYNELFYGCSNLNYIKAFFITTPDDTYTKDWVSGVARRGTFVKNKDATWDVTGVNGVPEGWTVLTDESSVPEAIDLGLPSGLKWASFNVGASKPEEYGDYYAWGEVETKDTYSWETYKWCNGSYNTLTKYNTQSDSGTVDNKTTLDPEDDVAATKLGGKWRMPTDEEWSELMDKCTWTWTTQNGVNGRLVTGLNGNTIFLPAAGSRRGTSLYNVGSHGYYWSSSLGTSLSRHALGVDFYSVYVYRDLGNRYYGQSVRPVLAE